MSAIGYRVDREAGVLWITHRGRGDELSMNLRHYGIDHVPALRNASVGITFDPALTEKSFLAFRAAAIAVVEALTARRGVAYGEQRAFGLDLAAVQAHQVKNTSEQGRDLAEWVRSTREKAGGIA